MDLISAKSIPSLLSILLNLRQYIQSRRLLLGSITDRIKLKNNRNEPNAVITTNADMKSQDELRWADMKRYDNGYGICLQLLLRNYIKMAEIGRRSMQIIAQESSRMLSQHNLKDSEAPFFELLIRAHDRIRTLQSENEELLNQLRRRTREDEETALLEQEVDRLNCIIREKDIKIQNLQRINQKAILDYVLIEKQLQAVQAEARAWHNITPIPSELNSPLSLSRINRKWRDLPQEGERVNLECARKLVAEQEKLALNRTQQKWKDFQIFTFDKENGHRDSRSPKVLKNCFSELEVNQLINKVQSRGDHKHCQSKQKLKQYHNYCSSIERKHSPNTASRKQPPFIPLKRPTLTLKTPIPNKFQLSFNDKPWTETCTSNTTAPSFGLFHEHSLKKLHFY